MSWQAYVDTNLVGTGKISKAAILGLAGGVWAASPGYTLSEAECKAITDAFNSPATHLDTIRSSGVRLAGQKFFTLSADERHIYGKKAADGCIIVKTKQAVLVAEYKAPVQAPEATPIVENLADYLVGAGY